MAKIEFSLYRIIFLGGLLWFVVPLLSFIVFLVSLHLKSRFNASKFLYQQTGLSLNLLHFIMVDVKSLQGYGHSRLPVLRISLYTVCQIYYKATYHLQLTWPSG